MRVATRGIEIAENSRDSACLTDFLRNGRAILGPHELPPRLTIYVRLCVANTSKVAVYLIGLYWLTLTLSEPIWQMTPPGL